MSSRAFKTAAYGHLAQVGKALANATRLEILELLAQAPRAVEVLAEEVDQSIANTSQHLQILKRAQLVTSERDGVRRIYALASDDVAALVDNLHDVASSHLASLAELTRSYFASKDELEPVDRDTLVERLRDGAVVLVDVRPEHEFAAGHLPGALSLPLGELESRLDTLPKNRAIVAYCRGPFCAFAAEAVEKLRAHGYDARRADVSARHHLEVPVS